jgi:hypothetical protein
LPATPLWVARTGATETADTQVRRAGWQARAQDRARIGRPSTAQVVGILAFCQSLLFLALWLFLCASVGAAPAAPGWANPQLKKSSFQPTRERDPFLPSGAVPLGRQKSTVASLTSLRLQGIVYETGRASAMVNNEIVVVGQPVILSTTEGAVQVTATEITRDYVVLDVGGRKFELRLGSPTKEQSAKP